MMRCHIVTPVSSNFLLKNWIQARNFGCGLFFLPRSRQHAETSAALLLEGRLPISACLVAAGKSFLLAAWLFVISVALFLCNAK